MLGQAVVLTASTLETLTFIVTTDLNYGRTMQTHLKKSTISACLGLLTASQAVFVTVAQAETVIERLLAAYDQAVLSGVLINASVSSYHPLSRDPAFLGIDGTISNALYGETMPDIESRVYATEAFSTLASVDFGYEDALAIGGVNSGTVYLDQIKDIIAGVSTGANMAVDQAMTQSAFASSTSLGQLGASPDSAVLVMNLASNENAIRGRVDNLIVQVGGSIGRITATGIGAVNTGEIQSGISSIVTDITGH